MQDWEDKRTNESLCFYINMRISYVKYIYVLDFNFTQEKLFKLKHMKSYKERLDCWQAASG